MVVTQIYMSNRSFINMTSKKTKMQVFNIQKADLFIVVLFITAISPWVAAKARGVL